MSEYEKTIALLLCLVLCLPGVSAWAENDEPETHTSGDFEYVVLDGGMAEMTEYSGKAKALTIPDKLDDFIVESIGDYAFYNCVRLTSITIPDSVTSIGNRAFSNCDSLTSVTIPDSVTSIGDYAFSDCSSLTSVTIPDSVTSIGVNPFKLCSNLKTINVSPDHPALAVIDGVLFGKEDKRLVCYPCAFTSKTYSIPEGISIIGDYAFSNCSSLTSITIPDSITSIGNDAFYDCSSLTSVTIPDSVTSIGICAFSFCSSLTSITIPESVTSIGGGAFADDNELLTLTVGRDSYAAQYCKENNLIYIYPDSNDWLNG